MKQNRDTLIKKNSKEISNIKYQANIMLLVSKMEESVNFIGTL